MWSKPYCSKTTSPRPTATTTMIFVLLPRRPAGGLRVSCVRERGSCPKILPYQPHFPGVLRNHLRLSCRRGNKYSFHSSILKESVFYLLKAAEELRAWRERLLNESTVQPFWKEVASPLAERKCKGTVIHRSGYQARLTLRNSELLTICGRRRKCQELEEKTAQNQVVLHQMCPGAAW